MNASIPTSNAVGADVYSAYSEIYQLLGSDDDRRVRARHPWKSSLTVWVRDEPHRSQEVREIRVVTTDISQSGFGFEYRQYVHLGSLLRTRFDALPNAPIIDGIVAYCHHVNDSVHHIGVQFMSVS